MDLLSSRFADQSVVGSVAMAEWLGCGKSSGPEKLEDLEMKSLAQDYIALVKGLGLNDVSLVAHSTGGLIALCAMAEAPELFRRAVLLDPVSAEGVQFGPEMYEAFTKMSQDRQFCDGVMASTIHRCNVNDPLVQELFEDAFHVHKMIWHGVADTLKKTNIQSLLAKIQQPVLILHGEHDAVLPIEGSKKMALALPQGEFVELKGQGHCANIENPTKFVDLVCEYLF